MPTKDGQVTENNLRQEFRKYLLIMLKGLMKDGSEDSTISHDSDFSVETTDNFLLNRWPALPGCSGGGRGVIKFNLYEALTNEGSVLRTSEGKKQAFSEMVVKLSGRAATASDDATIAILKENLDTLQKEPNTYTKLEKTNEKEPNDTANFREILKTQREETNEKDSNNTNSL